ncbi:MAG: 5-methyltetrahydropteroyltriglutamate--homocysteine S-methyltransferase [Xanthobacteraceae bacterium]
MQRTKPPFRADHVGSLLRAAPLKIAREKHERREITDGALKAVEDEEIKKIIRQQEEIGLQAISDGEFRRTFWHFDFLQNLDGCEGYWMETTQQHGGLDMRDQRQAFKGATLRPWMVRVIGKLGFSAHPHVEHFKFLKANTTRTPKAMIPSPSMLNYRGGRSVVSEKVYPNLDNYYADLAQAYAKALKAFYDAGCRYIQIDDVAFAYFCDDTQRQMLRDRGDDPDRQFDIYRQVFNAAIKDRPKDMVVTTHLCRGNFRSTFVGSGGYEPIAEKLFNDLDVDGYFLEWDTERAGGFEPLRLLPKGNKIVVLGLITTKTGKLEDPSAVKRRIEEASKFAALDQLALSPQCGFASTEEGNTLTYDEQWAKLKSVVDIAKEVWG